MPLGQGAEMRPFRYDVSSDHPECWECTWVIFEGNYRVKFINRMCLTHGRLLP